MKMRSSVCDLCLKQFFTFLSIYLTFYLVTLILCCIRRFIDVNYMCKFDEDPIICWKIIANYILPWPLTLWPWHCFTINVLSISILCESLTKIQSFVFNLWPKLNVHIITYLTLTFDLLTLTLGYLQRFVDINPMSSLMMIKSSVRDLWLQHFLYNCIFDFDLWPLTLTLCHLQRSQPSVKVWSRSNNLFMIYRRKIIYADMQTDRHTYIWMDTCAYD